MHVDPLPLSAYPWYLRPWLWWQRRRHGSVSPSLRVWARSPRLLASVVLLARGFERRGTPLEPSLRALVGLRVAQINECVPSVESHGRALCDLGVAREKVRSVGEWEEAEGFSSRERAALAYAEAVTASELPVSADIIGGVKRHFNDQALIELTGFISFQNMTTKFSHALDMPPQGLCTIGINERGEAIACAEEGSARKAGGAAAGNEEVP